LLPSPRTIKYFEAWNREGDNFNYGSWLKRVREEEAREKGEIQAPLPSKAVAEPRTTVLSGRDNPTAHSRTLGYPQIRAMGLSKGSTKVARKTQSNSMQAGLLRVIDAWDEFRDDRSRDGIYAYLKAVFSIVTRYRARQETEELLCRATKFAGLPFERNADPFATVIRCTCERQLDNKTISKFSRALRYAAHRNRPPRLLKPFMKRLGGINACADRYAKRLGRGVQTN
jgi:hypothetical protein